MAYNTGNASGSTHPKDLIDNAEDLDFLLTGVGVSHPNRLAVPLKSWKGMEGEFLADQVSRANTFIATQNAKQVEFDTAQLARATEYTADKTSRDTTYTGDKTARDTTFSADQANRATQFNAFMDASGFEPPIAYAAGILLDRTTKTVSYLGDEYRAKGSFIPLTTSDWATDESKLKLIGDDSLRQDLAASVSSMGFIATGDNDTGTPSAKFRVSRTHTLGTSPHAFRDQTVFAPPNANQAACSYDAALNSTGSQPIDHTIGFQSRNTHNGTGQLKDFYGCGSFNISNGPVTNHYGMYVGDKSYGSVGGHYGLYNRPGISGSSVNVYGMVHYPTINAGATVTNSCGLRIETADGSGTLTNEFGIYIKALTKGANKNPIYIEQQTGLNYIGAKTQIDHTLQVGANARLSLGGLTGSDFPAITYNFDPRLNTYIASSEASGFQWGSTNFTFRHAPAGTAGAAPTFTTLLNIHTANDANKGSLFPGTTNTQNLGIAGSIWKEIFAGNPTINTSDARLKTEVIGLSANELAAAKQLAKEIGGFKFLAAVAEKGDAARTHIGMTVQRAIEVLELHGLEPTAYSFICYDKWDETTVEHEALTIDHAAIIAEHEAVFEFGSIVDSYGQPIRQQVSEDWNEVVSEAWTETVREAWTEVTPAGDSYGFRATELLSFIAAGFEARLSAIESALDLA